MKYGTGLLQPLYKDPRDIPLGAVETPLTAPPSTYFADISTLPINNQGKTGSCVGQAVAKMKEYQEYIEREVTYDFSARGVYALAKKIDNYDGWGTYVVSGVKVAKDFGTFRKDKFIIEDVSLPDDEFRDWTIIPQTAYQEARNFKTKGYAYVFRKDLNAIKSAMVEHGVLVGGVNLTNEGFTVNHQDPMVRNPRTGETVYGHSILFYGYEPHGDGRTRLWFQNSWGQEWGNQGRGYLVFEEYAWLFDMWLSIDLPSELIIKAQNMIPLLKGDSRPEVYAHNTKFNTKAWVNREALLNWRGILWPDMPEAQLIAEYVQAIPQADLDKIRQVSVLVDTVEL